MTDPDSVSGTINIIYINLFPKMLNCFFTNPVVITTIVFIFEFTTIYIMD